MIQYTRITQLISELLYRHDCVIVPGFGGFVSRSHSAGFNKGNHLLFPPAKHILFNRNLVHNDGLLITSLMERQGISFEEASGLTDEYRQYIQSLLGAKKRFELQNIGLLYIDAENSLRFEAKADMNFLFDAFGFEPVTAIELPVLEEKPVHRQATFEDRTANTVAVTTTKSRRSYVRMAALAVGIPLVMGLMALVATSKPMQPLMQSSVNPFYTPEKTYLPDHGPERKAFIINDVAKPSFLADANGFAAFTLSERGRVMIAHIEDTAAADKTAVAKRSVKSKLHFNGRYQVVLGCFGVKQNAERLVGELRAAQVDAGISGVNAKGLHVVSCGSFDSKTEATELLDRIRGQYPNAWILAQ